MNDDTNSSSTDTAPPTPPPPAPRLLRRDADGKIGGVCGGLARYLGVDANFVRIAFVVAAFVGLSGVWIYAIFWALLPTTESTETRPIAITNDPWRMVFGISFALIVMGNNFQNDGFGFSLTIFSLLPLALIGSGIYLLNQRNQASPVRSAPVVDEPGPRWGTPLVGDAVVTDTVVSDTMYPIDSTTRPATIGAERAERLPVGRYTLAAAMLAVVIVGFIDLVGASIGVGAYFAAFTIISAVGFVGALVVGRALLPMVMVLLGLAGLVLAPAIDIVIESGAGDSSITVDPGVVPESRYALGAGELEVDFSDALIDEDLRVELEVGAGQLVVVVPDDVNVRIQADARLGSLEVLGRTSEGFNASIERYLEADSNQADSATLTLDIDVAFGEAIVRPVG